MVGIEITVRDTESGETETKTITDDAVVITAGNHYVASVASVVKHGNGTQIWTVKVEK